MRRSYKEYNRKRYNETFLHIQSFNVSTILLRFAQFLPLSAESFRIKIKIR